MLFRMCSFNTCSTLQQQHTQSVTEHARGVPDRMQSIQLNLLGQVYDAVHPALNIRLTLTVGSGTECEGALVAADDFVG